MPAVAPMLASAAAILAADERGLFHFPGVDDFRTQAIERTDRERDWPFTVSSGYLSCAWVFGKPAVYFVPNRETGPQAGEVDEGRLPAIVTTDPFELAFSNIGARDLIATTDTLEELIRRMAPFVETGRRLCEQPRGTDIGPSET